MATPRGGLGGADKLSDFLDSGDCFLTWKMGCRVHPTGKPRGLLVTSVQRRHSDHRQWWSGAGTCASRAGGEAPVPASRLPDAPTCPQCHQGEAFAFRASLTGPFRLL